MGCSEAIIYTQHYTGAHNGKKLGRKPDGESAGKRINIYFTEPREQLFEKAYNLLKGKGMLPSTATLSRSRTDVIDFALDALVAKLEQDDN